MLEREIIRDDVVARLLNKTTAGARVFPSRSIPLKHEDLPAIRVFTGSQLDSQIGIGVPVFRRVLQLGIEAVTTAATDDLLDSAADAMALAIKVTLLNDPEWVKQFESIEGIATQIEIDAESDRRRISAELVFSLRLSSMIYEPTLVDDLRKVHIDTDLVDPSEAPGPDGVIEVVQDLDLPAPT